MSVQLQRDEATESLPVYEQPESPRTYRVTLHRVLVAIRWILLLIYVMHLVDEASDHGVPLDRERIVLWICGGLLISTIGRSWKSSIRLVLDWVPFVLLFLAYDYSRGAATKLGFPTHMTPQIELERALFLGRVPAVSLQAHFYDPSHVHWWDIGASFTYVSHYFAVFVVAGVLWARNRVQWRRFVARLLTVSFAAVAVFCLAPTAPPWMASDSGNIGPITRLVDRGTNYVGMHWATSLLHKGQDTFNGVAAVPSLHAAYPALIALFFWPVVRNRWLRGLLLAYPIMMLFSIVYLGEHYVVDALAAYVLVFVVCRVWDHVEARTWRRLLGPAPNFVRWISTRSPDRSVSASSPR